MYWFNTLVLKSIWNFHWSKFIVVLPCFCSKSTKVWPKRHPAEFCNFSNLLIFCQVLLNAETSDFSRRCSHPKSKSLTRKWLHNDTMMVKIPFGLYHANVGAHFQHFDRRNRFFKVTAKNCKKIRFSLSIWIV